MPLDQTIQRPEGRKHHKIFDTLRQAVRAKNRGFNSEPGKDKEMAAFIANKVKARAEASDSLNILTPHAKGQQQKRKGRSPFEGPAEAKRKILQLIELREKQGLATKCSPNFQNHRAKVGQNRCPKGDK